MSAPIPNPGSAGAIALGCACPTIENQRGAGCGPNPVTGEPMFWVSAECPMHYGTEASPTVITDRDPGDESDAKARA